MIDRVVADFGRLDVLVCNAGIASHGRSVADTDPDEPARLLGVHAVGAHHLAALALPHLRRHDRSDVVMVSSTAAARAAAGGAPYMMAKVAPGLTVTDMGNPLAHAVTGAPGAADLDAASPFGRVTRPEDVAAVVAFLVSADAAMVTGQRIEVTSGTPMPSTPEPA